MQRSEMRICRESLLTHYATPRPSWLGTNNRLFLPTGEGAPSKNEGVGGDFKMGFGEVSPMGLGKAQGLKPSAERTYWPA